MHHLWFLLFLLILNPYNQSEAGEILRQKGKKVIVDIQGENIRSGDKINVYHQSKRRGVIQVQKLNKDKSKALGRIILGSGKKGWTASKSAPKEEGVKGATAASPSSKKDSSKKLYYGALLGISMDSMSVDIGNPNPESVDLSGMGFSIKGAADYSFSNTWQARVKVGAELFDASGSPSNSSNCVGTDCKAEITYFTMEGLMQYYLSKSQYSFWIGGGGAIAHPLSASSNAINADDLSTTSALQIGGGMDIGLKSGSYIPIEVLYSMLPKSDSVQATYITVNVGFLF